MDMEKMDRNPRQAYEAPAVRGIEWILPWAILASDGQSLEDPRDNGELDW